MHVFLETQRLIITVPTENDIEDQYQLQSDPDVMQYIGAGVRDHSEIRKNLGLAIKHYQKHGFSAGSVFEKETAKFVGRAGIFYMAFDDTQPDIEIGYGLLASYWNKGYATELTKALIEWGFSNLSVEKFVAYVRLENDKSRRVLEKAGMHFSKVLNKNGIEKHYYEIARNAFSAVMR